MKFLRKFLSLRLENLRGKLTFDHLFLTFSRVSGAVGEFFAFYFFPFAVWGDFSCWCGIQADWGEGSPPPSRRVTVWLEDSTTFLQHFFRFPGGAEGSDMGEELPQAASIQPAGKSPQTAHGKNEKAKNSPAASGILENGQKSIFH